MHVGRKCLECPTLKVHGQNMTEVNEITYLGDIVSADGRNINNIHNRARKGMGIVCQIFKILQSANLGPKLFETAILLRESVFINGIITNSEVWHHLKTSETEELEKVDRYLLCKLFGVPRSVPQVALYLGARTDSNIYTN